MENISRSVGDRRRMMTSAELEADLAADRVRYSRQMTEAELRAGLEAEKTGRESRFMTEGALLHRLHGEAGDRS